MHDVNKDLPAGGISPAEWEAWLRSEKGKLAGLNGG